MEAMDQWTSSKWFSQAETQGAAAGTPVPSPFLRQAQTTFVHMSIQDLPMLQTVGLGPWDPGMNGRFFIIIYPNWT